MFRARTVIGGAALVVVAIGVACLDVTHDGFEPPRDDNETASLELRSNANSQTHKHTAKLSGVAKVQPSVAPTTGPATPGASIALPAKTAPQIEPAFVSTQIARDVGIPLPIRMPTHVRAETVKLAADDIADDDLVTSSTTGLDETITVEPDTPAYTKARKQRRKRRAAFGQPTRKASRRARKAARKHRKQRYVEPEITHREPHNHSGS